MNTIWLSFHTASLSFECTCVFKIDRNLSRKRFDVEEIPMGKITMHFYNPTNYYSHLNKVYADCSGIIDEEVENDKYILQQQLSSDAESMAAEDRVAVRANRAQIGART